MRLYAGTTPVPPPPSAGLELRLDESGQGYDLASIARSVERSLFETGNLSDARSVIANAARVVGDAASAVDAAAVVGRFGLNYGTYEPAYGDTAGLTDPSLITSSINNTATQTWTPTQGTVYTNQNIYGDIIPPSVLDQNIYIFNSRIRGGNYGPTSGSHACVRSDNIKSGSGRIIIVDCDIDPILEHLNRDGVRGNRVEVHRSRIRGGIDGLSLFAFANQNGGDAFSYGYGNIIEDLAYGFPDYKNGTSGAVWHSDGAHTDPTAINGGRNIGLIGNLIRGTAHNLPGAGQNPTHPELQATPPYYANGQGTLITNTTGVPLDTSVVIRANRYYGGLAHLGIQPNMPAITLEDNLHYRAVYVDPNTANGNSSSGYWIRYSQRAGNGVVPVNSRWIDGPFAGQLLAEPRNAGIHFNA